MRTASVRGLLAALAIFLFTAVPASATTFPLNESFSHSTASGWNLRGNASLTGDGEQDPDGAGWLRLTSALNDQTGAAFNSTAFDSSQGMLVSFDYAAWGGTGADGTSVFLFDGSVPDNSFQVGANGGGLGYTSCNGSPTSNTGVPGGYVGIGLDEWGNYSAAGYCGRPLNDGLLWQQTTPNVVGVRGPQTGGYAWLGGAVTSQDLQADRADARLVTVAVADQKAYVWIQYPNGERQVVLDGQPITGTLPATLKVGFAAATGGSNNNHEIGNVHVALPVDLSAHAEQQPSPGGRNRTVSWQVVVNNSDLNSTSAAPVTFNGSGLSDVSWTCTGGEGGTCSQASGTGTNAGSVDLDQSGSVTYNVTATVTDAADTADLGFDVEPGPANGELTPADNVGTTPVDLTPVADMPQISLSSSGVASVAQPDWRGGDVTTSYHWLRCDPSGVPCEDIDGATSSTYNVTADDAGHTLRVRITGSNAAGTVNPVTDAWTLPDTELTSGPASLTSSTSAVFAVSGGSAYQCSLDGGTWTGCTATPSYSGLAEGSHTLKVRTVYGGLYDASAATYSWTVRTTPPAAPTVATAPAGHSNDPSPTLSFGVPSGTTLKCRVDGGAWADCTSGLHLSQLAEGNHTVEAKAVIDSLGLESAVTSVHWTIDTAAPAAPVVLAGPSAQTSSHDARVDLSGDPDATFECSLDGADFAPCVSPVELTGVTTGQHSLRVRQVDAAGNASAPVEVRWTVTADPAAPSGPPTLSAHISSRATVENGNTVGVGCHIDGDSVQTCTVKAYVNVDAHGHVIAAGRVLVGTGTTTVKKGGVQSVLVHVHLNARGRKLLRGRVGGVPVQLEVNARLTGGAVKHAKVKATLLPRKFAIVPVGPFTSGGSAVRTTAAGIVKRLARDVETAKRITCTGNTDSAGSAERNLRLGMERARQVCRALRAAGVKARFVVRSAGETRPRATNLTAAGRQLNRRVEVRIRY